MWLIYLCSGPALQLLDIISINLMEVGSLSILCSVLIWMLVLCKLICMIDSYYNVPRFPRFSSDFLESRPDSDLLILKQVIWKSRCVKSRSILSTNGVRETKIKVCIIKWEKLFWMWDVLALCIPSSILFFCHLSIVLLVSRRMRGEGAGDYIMWNSLIRNYHLSGP